MNPASEKAFEEIAGWLRTRSRGTGNFVLGIGGPGGCGKSTFSRWLLSRLGDASLLPLDDFRHPREKRRKQGLYGSNPEGNDLARLRRCLELARAGQPFERPVFDPSTGAATASETVPPSRVLLCDGEIAAHALLRDLFDGLIVVEAHWRTQLNTRLTRDLRERQCSLEKAVDLFLQSNLRDYPRFAAGATKAADFVLYRNSKDRFTIKRRGEWR